MAHSYRRSAVLGMTLVAVLLSSAGCSPGAKDEPGLIKGAAGVKAVVETFINALRSGNGPRACSLIDPPAQRLLIDATQQPDCLGAVPAWASAHPDIPALKSSDLVVQIDGDTATATLPDHLLMPPLASDGVFHLNHESLRWGITTSKS